MSHVSKLTWKRIDWFVAAVGLLALAAALPLLAEPGLLNTRGGGDSPFLLQRLQQLETALRDGHFPVRWMPDANYGYGYPFFNFYAPLSIYIAAVFRFLGFSYVGAIEAAQVAGYLAAAWGMYRLARRWWGSAWVGAVTAVAYTFAPFHMVNVYVRGDSLAEFWAMAWYPWVILAADAVINVQGTGNSKRRAIAGLALAYAALVLSHNISALIFSPFLLLYILLKWLKANGQWSVANLQSPISNLFPLAVSLLLGLALAAWFFVPALGEQSLAQLGPVTEGYFHYSNHFRGADLVQGSLFFEYDVAGGKAFRMGLVQAATAVLGLLAFLLQRNKGRKGQRQELESSRASWLPRPSAPLLFTTLALLVATFMITPLSRPLWDHLPLLPFTQFPWRFLSVQAFAGALAAGGLALLPWQRAIAPMAVVLLAASGLGALRTDHLVLTDADVTAEKLAQYEWFTGNIGTTVSAEYLPSTVTPRPYTGSWLNTGQRHQVRALSGELGDSELVQFATAEQEWRVTAVSPSMVQFATMAWPGWAADVDGAPVEIRPSPGSGLIALELPQGTHAVTLRLARTPMRLAAEWGSLVALLVTVWLVWPRKRPLWRRWVLALVGLILVALAAQFWPRHELPDTDLTWDFAQMGYLHHAPQGVPFANGGKLQEYRYDRETLAPGETLTVQLAASGLAGFNTEVALLTPAALRWEEADAFPMTQAAPAPQEPFLEYHLAIPENAPPGLYVPRLRVGELQESAALTPSGQPRGDLFLRPVRVVAAPEMADAGELAVELTQFVAQDGLWSARLRWATAQPLARNYNVSLRVLDEAGNLVTHFDAQPGYGFLPSGLWPPGQWVHDWLSLRLPESLPERAVLMVQLYEIGGATVLYRRLGTVQRVGSVWTFAAYARQFALPAEMVAETAVFLANETPVIQLHGYNLAQTETAVTLTLYWEALAALTTNYTRFVHVLDARGQLVVQNDAMPQDNSYPTSQWLPAEIVPDAVTLDLSSLAPGEYQVLVGWYENLGDRFPQLTAVSGTAVNHSLSPYPENRVPLLALTR